VQEHPCRVDRPCWAGQAAHLAVFTLGQQHRGTRRIIRGGQADIGHETAELKVAPHPVGVGEVVSSVSHEAKPRGYPLERPGEVLDARACETLCLHILPHLLKGRPVATVGGWEDRLQETVTEVEAHPESRARRGYHDDRRGPIREIALRHGGQLAAKERFVDIKVRRHRRRKRQAAS
jgi:hypothetical protein